MWLTHKIMSHFFDRHASTSHGAVYFERGILNFFRKRKNLLFSVCTDKICVRAGNVIKLMVALPKPVLLLNTALQAMFQHRFCHIPHSLHILQPAARKAGKSQSRGSGMVAGSFKNCLHGKDLFQTALSTNFSH